MEDIRFIENPFAKIFNIINADKNKISSLMLNLISQFIVRVHLPSIVAINSNKRVSQDISAYCGGCGYLLTLIRLYRHFKHHSAVHDFGCNSALFADITVNQFTDPDFFLQLAQEQYTALRNYVSKHNKPKDISYYMSDTCLWVCGAHLAHDTLNYDLFRQNVQQLIRKYNFVVSNRNIFQWEVLYGVPGFLFALLQVHAQYYNHGDIRYKIDFSEEIVVLTRMIIEQGVENYEKLTKKKISQGLPQDFRLVYMFYEKEYLGGAHGLGGNLNIILLAMKVINFGEEIKGILPLLTASIKVLLKNRINDNFVSANGSKKSKLVHFCHGAPGIVGCLARFANMFPQVAIEMKLMPIIQASLDHIWKFGVLKKGFSLCHGISGNAYAFIHPAVQQLFPEKTKEFLKKAELFAILREEEGVMKEISTFDFQDRDVVGVSDNPYSLMLGIAGDICFTIDVLEGVGKFPGFDF